MMRRFWILPSGPSVLSGCIVLLVAGLYVWMTYLEPRPYSIIMTDVEVDYYYNARLAHQGLPVAGIHHPGTPVHFLGALIFATVGADIALAQDFFNLAYAVLGALSILALLFFVRTTLEDLPPGVAFLALASVVAWPTFSFYLNKFGADAFVVISGLPAITFFWRALGKELIPRYRHLFLCGVFVGLSLAIKMSFVPLAVALLAGCTIRVFIAFFCYLAEGRRLAGFWPYALLPLAMPAGAWLTFRLLTLPIHERLPEIWREMSGGSGLTFGLQEMAGRAGNVLLAMATANWLLVCVLIAIVCAFLFCVCALVHRSLFSPGIRGTLLSVTRERFDHLSGAAFLLIAVPTVLLLLATEASATRTALVGVGQGLRNVYPVALVFPFVIVFCWRTYFVHRDGFIIRNKFFQPALLVISLLVIAQTVSVFLQERHGFIRLHAKRIENAQKAIMQNLPPGTRVAVWDGTVMHALGEVSFHWWGNYRYARSSFDADLGSAYPSFTQFRLLDLEARFKEKQDSNTVTTANAELIAMQRHGAPVSMIAIPVAELESRLAGTASDPVRGFLEFAEGHYEVQEHWKQSINDVDWIFVRLK